MPNPRSLGDLPVRDLPALLTFVNSLWLPDYRLLRKKLGAMLNQPTSFAKPVWDGQSWHSVLEGSLGADLPDADGSLDVALGTVYVAREGTLTGGHTYTPTGSTSYDSITVWNLTTQHTLTIALAAGDMSLPPLYVGRVAGAPVTFYGLHREPVTMDPSLFGAP